MSSQSCDVIGQAPERSETAGLKPRSSRVSCGSGGSEGSLAVHDERASASARLAFNTAWEAQGSMLAHARAAFAPSLCLGSWGPVSRSSVLHHHRSTRSSPELFSFYPKGLKPLMSRLGLGVASTLRCLQVDCRRSTPGSNPEPFGWESNAIKTHRSWPRQHEIRPHCHQEPPSRYSLLKPFHCFCLFHLLYSPSC